MTAQGCVIVSLPLPVCNDMIKTSTTSRVLHKDDPARFVGLDMSVCTSEVLLSGTCVTQCHVCISVLVRETRKMGLFKSVS